MKLIRPLPCPAGLIFFLLCWPRQPVVLAETNQDLSSKQKRYYHHEVHLDPGKHNDEFFSFVTRPDLDAPRWDVEIFNEDAIAPGYWFSAPYSDLAQSKADAPWNAPHIYDHNGDLIWSGAPVFDGFTTFDFRVVIVQGKPMLSLVYPRGGQAIIFDEAYRVHKIVNMGAEELRENEWALNSHEFMTAENGTKALHLMRMPRKTSEENSNAVDFEGECFAIFDGIKELDTETWATVNTWDSEGRIGLDESYVDLEPVSKRCTGNTGWDFFHANSIDTFPNGDYLISGRRTNAIYKISRTTGSIIWRLGGRKSDFEMSVKFSGQHAARIHEQNDTHTVISLLDNAYLPPGNPQTTHDASRGLLISLDTTTMTAKTIAQYEHPEHKYAMSRGNMYMLSNNNAWVCWTDGSLQSEYTFDGTLILKARFKARISSYRTFKFPWIGRPDSPPDVHAAIVDKNGQWYTIVHMSWNGATEVVSWKIYHTNAEGEERQLVATVAKRGFETSAWTEGYRANVVAEALDKDGTTLGVSNVFASLPPRNHSQHIAEISSHSENVDTWLQSMVNNSLVAFTCGVFLGCAIVLLAWGILKRDLTCWQSLHPAYWTRRKGMYEPLLAEHDDEDMKLEGLRGTAKIETPTSDTEPNVFHGQNPSSDGSRVDTV